MYKSGLAVSIKKDGSNLRERNGIVYLPFNSYYTIYLKNTTDKKASVSIEVDGRSLGANFLVDPNSSYEIERFIDGNNNKGKKFLFVEKTDDVVERFGDNEEDGKIEISFRFEQTKHFYNPYKQPYKPHPYRPHTPYIDDIYYIYDNNTLNDNENYCCYSSTVHSNSMGFVDNNVRGCSLNEEGRTIKGEESNQKFVDAYIGELEYTTNYITIKLKGGNKSITTKKKIRCLNPTCGKYCKSDMNFCPKCGSELKI